MKNQNLKAVRPQIAIIIGGETRHLIFDFNAFAELEDLAGTFHSKAPTRKLIMASLYAGMLRETLDKAGNPTDRTLTMADVAAALDGVTREQLAEYLVAITKAQGIAVEDPENPPQAQDQSEAEPVSTGSTSGPAPDTTSGSSTPTSGD